jgi:ribonuclease P protein component
LRPAEFKRVYDRRQSAASGPLVLYAAPNELPVGRVRLGLSVSRRVGNAVVRNRWKRRLREAFRSVRHAVPAGNDYILVVRGGEPGRGAEGLQRAAAAIADLARRVTGRRGYGSGVGR